MDNEWKEKLTDEEYHILREKGTEAPFTGKYYHFDKEGIYSCAACGTSLFSSETKYDSGSGWPSFFAPYDSNSIELKVDESHGMQRIEVLCKSCQSHLGHVFDDGPAPTHKRYCLNSISLKFKPNE